MGANKFEERIRDLLARNFTVGPEFIQSVTEFMAATANIIEAVYGRNSRQSSDLTHSLEAAVAGIVPTHTTVLSRQVAIAKGVLSNTLQELQLGLIITLNAELSGELFGDFLLLAKSALEENHDNRGKNVAAVLSAALFEDTVRRMGKLYASVEDRRDLADVVTALKEHGILIGAQLTTTIGYLKFRNDALHADFEKIERTTVASVIAFLEQLLLKHFS